MKLEIRPLSPELLDDYLHFFDNVAFADHPAWSKCYCMHFHWQPEWDNEPPKSSRDRAIAHIGSGAMQGYLAYHGGDVVGWCNANDRQNYRALARRKEGHDETEADMKVKSVVCFLVAPQMRGKGVATKLLERACADARADGYNFIEAYPPTGEWDMFAAYHGTTALYEKFGFKVHRMLKKESVMRKYLGEGL